MQFCTYVKHKFKKKFANCRVLDIGSLDINGNNRFLFDGDYEYVGVDIGEGKNVDVVCRGHEYIGEKPFDVVISTECFEHDEFYDLTLQNMYLHLKPGGIFLFTCATTGRKEHGTKRTSPKNAPFVTDYYKNITEQDVREVLNVQDLFSDFQFIARTSAPHDLYFWGVKKKQ